MPFFDSRDVFLIEGIMPQRALLRLKRAKIDLYHVKKIKKNQILFSVSQKDSEKVFAIYPNVCYNISVYSPFTVKKIGVEGVARYLEACKRRVGLFLGGLFCMASLFYFDGFVFSVELTASTVYEREAKIALENVGIKPFSLFQADKTDLACAQILALDGVEFCSVRKSGFFVEVEIRCSPFEKLRLQTGPLITPRDGKLLELTVLKGEPTKEVGEEVRAGETLVKDVLVTEDGGQVCVETVARAQIGCVYEASFDVETEEEAFALAYLELCLSDQDTIVNRCVEQRDNLFHVKVEYIILLAINL